MTRSVVMCFPTGLYTLWDLYEIFFSSHFPAGLYTIRKLDAIDWLNINLTITLDMVFLKLNFKYIVYKIFLCIIDDLLIFDNFNNW